MSSASLSLVPPPDPRLSRRARSGRLARATRAGLASLATLALPLLGLVVGPVAPAGADTAPEPPTTLTTVSADELPTVQIDGVVWDQIVVGDTVYAVGSFTSARPAGAPAGTDETPRSNILAYSLSTGELITSWAPTLNDEAKAIVASADGSRIFVGGSFTQVSGVNRYRVVALDATTGAVVPNWNVVTNSRVRSLAISGDTLYMGGIFSIAGNQPRNRLAAVSASTGALLPWAPTADAEVLALVAPEGSGKVVAGGKFANLNSTGAYGMGALDATTGALLPWAVNATVRNAGADAAIYSLSTDGEQVYGTGYTFGSGGNFESTFAARASDGALVYVTGCLGDTYDSVAIEGVLYDVSHTHNCSFIGGNPELTPRDWQRASAKSSAPAASGAVNVGGTFNGQPAPEFLHWTPYFEAGLYTGSGQAAWTIEGNSEYLALGGEFTQVNSSDQQGLVRFAISRIAPDEQGPQGGSELTPTVVGTVAGTTRVSWKPAYDRDNRRLTYEVLRGSSLASSVPVATIAQDTAWWSRPTMSFTDDTAAPGGTETYRIRVKDAFDNVVTGNPVSVTVPAGTPSGRAYSKAVRSDGASGYWRLNEATGAPGYDRAGVNDLTIATTATRGVAGGLVGDSDLAVSFAGSGTVPAAATLVGAAPQTFSEEAWFKTSSTTGGKIIGYGSSRTASSGTADRNIYLTSNGRLAFGVTAASTLTTTTTYNNGEWHHVVGTLGTSGMRLYVDGSLVASNSVTSGAAYNGYWRIAGDAISSSWPNRPSSTALNGTIDEVAVYPTALSASAVAKHRELGLGVGLNELPTAVFESSSLGLTASFDASNSTDPEGTELTYDWDFGDGSSGDGASPSHTYTADGTYTVELTVTDAGGASATHTDEVTVAAPVAGDAVAQDAFDRTVASGWGSADTGGAWSLSASGSTLSVAEGNGRASVPAGRTVTARLNAVNNLDTDLTTAVWLDEAPTGGGAYVSTIVRSTSTGDYRARVKLLASGAVQTSLTATAGATETALTSTLTVPGLTYTPGSKLLIRVQASGAAPTTLRSRIWLEGTAEPDTWQQTVTDSTVGLDSAGGVGLLTYISGSATQAAVLHFDDFTATRL